MDEFTRPDHALVKVTSSSALNEIGTEGIYDQLTPFFIEIPLIPNIGKRPRLATPSLW